MAASVGEHGSQGASSDFLFHRGLCAKLLGQLSLFRVPSYLYMYVYVFLI
jgi:hypothetical protein